MLNTAKSSKTTPTITKGGLAGSVSIGPNSPGIFLALCQAYRELNLDIITVDSKVQKGWFVKWILARHRGDTPISLKTFRARLSRVARNFDFTSECFIVPAHIESGSQKRSPNIAILLQAENRIGLLADLLEVLERHDVDIIDIEIQVDEAAQAFALLFRVRIPLTAADFYDLLKILREEIQALGQRLEIATFHCMVHSTETFAFLQEIDFEEPV